VKAMGLEDDAALYRSILVSDGFDMVVVVDKVIIIRCIPILLIIDVL
jgi:hypothetical protein